MVAKHLVFVVATLGTTLTAVSQSNEVTTGFKGCDALLDSGLNDIVVFPGSSAYNTSMSTYYSSENRRVQPWCIVQPRSAQQVSTVVQALGNVSGAGHWGVAVRSGGHGYTGSNAIRYGVIIDLTFLNSTELVQASHDNEASHWNGTSVISTSIARIHPAAKWGNIISYLEQYNLSVTGGRSGDVGAAGLLLAGGISYHSQLWGMSCDNVINYEVVLANGSIIEANRHHNKDLFRALKGGGNNFGIVTRFDMRTFTLPPDGVYGGLMVPTWDSVDTVKHQFVDYVHSIGMGSHDHEFVVWRSNGTDHNMMVMTVSTDGNKASPNFLPFDNISTDYDFRALQPLSNLAASTSDTGGSYDMAFVLTLQATMDIMDKCEEVFLSLAKDVKQAQIPLSITAVFQPLPKHLASASSDGNVLGLKQNLPDSSIIFDIGGTLEDSAIEYEGVAYSKLAKAVEELRLFSAARERHSSYVYMNYANPEQDTIGSYGNDNVEFLKYVAAKYDAHGFFQYRVSGGAKLSRAGYHD
ncbi:hypothetical protein FOMG_17694 [Fusarium oxysporum f. sp. melonis 26406]|uniref:FAD-binding PCMH-type domain-containing protein n=1 Tax=Fusarium oxysporum f. sp. melonis 26406 TaxID=1089452 RepID=W9ZAP0_FUSOX|nr:hypothetical protein FOMG_17694 [Fusarium oxysporum f. sp. melonis 26406]